LSLKQRHRKYSLLTAGVSRLVEESLSQADSVYLSRSRIPSAVKVWIREVRMTSALALALT